MGDQSKLVLLKAVVEVIQEEGLLQRVQESGRVLLSGLENIQVILIVIFFFLSRHCSVIYSVVKLSMFQV